MNTGSWLGDGEDSCGRQRGPGKGSKSNTEGPRTRRRMLVARSRPGLGGPNPAAGLPPLLRVPEDTKGFDLDLATSKGV